MFTRRLVFWLETSIECNINFQSMRFMLWETKSDALLLLLHQILPKEVAVAHLRRNRILSKSHTDH